MAEKGKTTTEIFEDADNVYRTEKYIVKQVIGIKRDAEEDTVSFSHDTYYKRTKERDETYEFVYCIRKNKDGRRIPVVMYARTYVN